VVFDVSKESGCQARDGSRCADGLGGLLTDLDEVDRVRNSAAGGARREPHNRKGVRQGSGVTADLGDRGTAMPAMRQVRLERDEPLARAVLTVGVRRQRGLKRCAHVAGLKPPAEHSEGAAGVASPLAHRAPVDARELRRLGLR